MIVGKKTKVKVTQKWLKIKEIWKKTKDVEDSHRKFNNGDNTE